MAGLAAVGAATWALAVVGGLDDDVVVVVAVDAAAAGDDDDVVEATTVTVEPSCTCGTVAAFLKIASSLVEKYSGSTCCNVAQAQTGRLQGEASSHKVGGQPQAPAEEEPTACCCCCCEGDGT